MRKFLLFVLGAYSSLLWAGNLPYQTELNLQDIQKLKEATRFLKAEDFDVIDVELSAGRLAICTTLVAGKSKNVECQIGKYPLDTRAIDELNEWIENSKGALVPVLKKDDDVTYHLVNCQSDGALNPSGQCLLVHLFLNPRALTVKTSQSAKALEGLTEFWDKFNGLYVTGSDEFCLEVSQSERLWPIIKRAQDLGIPDLKLEESQKCAHQARPSESKKALVVSVMGSGPMVDLKDLERVYGLIAETLPSLEKYLITAHGMEGGHQFCLLLKATTSDQEYETIYEKFKAMPFNRQRSEKSVTKVENCEKSQSWGEYIPGKRDFEQEKLAAPQSPVRAQRRAQERADYAAQKALVVEFYEAARLVLARTIEVLPGHLEVAEGLPSLYFDESKRTLSVSMIYKLKGGGECTLLQPPQITFNGQSKAQLSRTPRLLCYPRSGQEKSKLFDLGLESELAVRPTHKLEMAWNRVYMHLVDRLGTGVSKGTWMRPSLREETQQISGIFEVETLDGQICTIGERLTLSEDSSVPGGILVSELPALNCYARRNEGGYPVDLVRSVEVNESDFPFPIDQSSYVLKSLQQSFFAEALPKIKDALVVHFPGLTMEQLKDVRASEFRHPVGLELIFYFNTQDRMSGCSSSNDPVFYYRQEIQLGEAPRDVFSAPLKFECYRHLADRTSEKFEIVIELDHQIHPALSALYEAKQWVDNEFRRELIKAAEASLGGRVTEERFSSILYPGAGYIWPNFALNWDGWRCSNHENYQFFIHDGKIHVNEGIALSCYKTDQERKVVELDSDLFPPVRVRENRR